MKTLILNDEVEFDLSEQHGLIVRFRSREYPDNKGYIIHRRTRAPINEQVTAFASDAIATLSSAETARLKEFLNDPECHRSWW